MAAFERGPETAALVSVLKTLRPGEEITIETLVGILKFTPRPEQAYRAREIIAREGGGVIDPLPHGRGYRRLTDEEAIHVASERYTRKARNAGERGARSLASVDYDELKDADKVEHNVRLSMLGALRLVISPRARKALQGVVAGSGAALANTDVMRLFEKVK